jgi:Tol biopolymer transport system component
MPRPCGPWPGPILALVLGGCTTLPPLPAPPAAPTPAPSPTPAPALEQRQAVGALPLSAAPVVLKPSPLPGRVPPAPAVWVPTHDLVAFVSNREGHGFDVFLYDATRQTVWAPPGVNTGADDFNPSLSYNNRWLVYSTNASGNFDVRLFDLRTQLVNTLEAANTPADEVSPTINGDGTVIAYTSRERGLDRLHLFNLVTGQNLVPAVVARTCKTINNPFISTDSRQVAFSSPVEGRGLDIFLYDVIHATLGTPPFLNSEADDDEPCLSAVDARICFSTRRRGNLDVMEADLKTGFVNPLVLANSDADDLTPSYVGPHAERLVFVSDRAGKGNRRMLAYNLHTAVLDTLPASHQEGSEDTFSP